MGCQFSLLHQGSRRWLPEQEATVFSSGIWSVGAGLISTAPACQAREATGGGRREGVRRALVEFGQFQSRVILGGLDRRYFRVA